MELKNAFEVAASADVTWDFMLAPDKVVPCMPGAELVEVREDGTWVVKAKVKLGTVSLSYKGKVTIDERDDEAKSLVMRGSGSETRGKGNVKAEIRSQVTAKEDGGTRVEIVTDLTISGRAAQLGRGMVADVSARFTRQFAEAMEYRLAEEAERTATAAADEASAEAERAVAEARAAEADEGDIEPPDDDDEGDAGGASELESMLRRAEAAARKAESAAKKAATSAKKAEAAAKKADAAVKRMEAAQQKLALSRQSRPDDEVGGLGLMIWAVGRAIRRFFGRLFGSSSDDGATEES